VLSHLPETGWRIKSSIDEKPPPVRLALYLGPGGLCALLLAAFIAASNAVCVEECIRVGDSLEDRLLECMDHCE
ncbi:unnamed protein product, partial [Polarella glacialis]